MVFILQFISAVRHCMSGFGLMFRRGLWPFLLYPLILWILLWIVSIYSIFRISDLISAEMTSLFDLSSIPEEGHWLSFMRDYMLGIFSFLISLTLKILFWFIAGTFIKYLLLMILSPVFSLLSEKVEEKITGTSFAFSGTQLLRDIFRGIGISFINMFREYLYIFLCFIVSLIFPPLIVITAPLLFFIGWYYVGFTLIDYNCERHQMRGRESNELIRNNKGYACGVGMVYSLFMAIPFPLSFIGIVFGPAMATAGGTLSFLELMKRS